MKFKLMIPLALVVFGGCSMQKNNNSSKIKLITLDPGHFHAALVQKAMYKDVDANVHVYAPKGDELAAHLKLIELYNNRAENPTTWNEVVYTGSDYLDKMLSERKGNVVVLAGNNQYKTANIKKAVDASLHVLSDKPMAIDKPGFEVLKQAFSTAEKNKVLLYDIMTERYEITNILQKEIFQMKEVFGVLERGTVDQPAIIKESVHHFFKQVSGAPLIRPAWYYDVNQAGNGLVDVTTHLVDLIQWTCFPDVSLNNESDVKMQNAKRWTTAVSAAQFKKSTKKDEFPKYLMKDVDQNNTLNVYANGEMNYTLKGVHAKVGVVWNFEAPQGQGDTHYSLLRGTLSNLVIRQGSAQGYKPVLYIEPHQNGAATKQVVLNGFAKLQKKYPGITLQEEGDRKYKVLIPEKYKLNHEAHFAEVTKKYLSYIKLGKLPTWEVNNMIVKYYTTTQALEKAIQSSK